MASRRGPSILGGPEYHVCCAVSICIPLPHFLQLSSSSACFNMAAPTEASSYLLEANVCYAVITCTLWPHFLQLRLYSECFKTAASTEAISYWRQMLVAMSSLALSGRISCSYALPRSLSTWLHQRALSTPSQQHDAGQKKKKVAAGDRQRKEIT